VLVSECKYFSMVQTSIYVNFMKMIYTSKYVWRGLSKILVEKWFFFNENHTYLYLL